MDVTIRKLSYSLGAEISGIDITKPLSEEAFGIVHDAFLKHCVLLFRGQPLTHEQYIAFSRRFGTLSLKQGSMRKDYPEVSSVANVPTGNSSPASSDYNGSDWHSDISYRVSPNIITMLKAVELPQVGGDTQFANLYLAYETLSDGMKKLIDGLEGVHIQQEKDLDHSSPERLEAARRDMTAAHSLVKVHPESGRKSLFVGDKVVLIAGMSQEESRPLLDFLCQHAQRPQFVYVHQWQKHDLVVWDQRCTNHNAVGNFDRKNEARLLEKTTILGPVSGRPYHDTTGARNLTHGFNY